jgi:heat shock protein HslJ
MLRTPLAVLTLIALVSLAACGEDDGGSAAQGDSLEGTPWVVESGLKTPGWEKTPPGATFQDGAVSGSSGCNRFHASYELEGDSLKLGAIATTEMACPEPAMTVEQEYVDALRSVAGWRIEDGVLVLLDEGGAELLRLREPSPVGTWTATSVRLPDSVSSLIAGTEISATFADDGTLTGSAGCNSYRATYTLAGGDLRIGAPVATKMACTSPAGVMEQEQAYLTALPQTRGYEIDGNGLTLLTAEGTIVATFAPSA